MLVMPRRVVPRFADLTLDEIGDLWVLARAVGILVEKESVLP